VSEGGLGFLKERCFQERPKHELIGVARERAESESRLPLRPDTCGLRSRPSSGNSTKDEILLTHVPFVV
jgi:hypothetical protein